MWKWSKIEHGLAYIRTHSTFFAYSYTLLCSSLILPWLKLTVFHSTRQLPFRNEALYRFQISHAVAPVGNASERLRFLRLRQCCRRKDRFTWERRWLLFRWSWWRLRAIISRRLTCAGIKKWKISVLQFWIVSCLWSSRETVQTWQA